MTRSRDRLGERWGEMAVRSEFSPYAEGGTLQKKDKTGLGEGK